MITGQLILWKSSQQIQGRTLYPIFGIIAPPRGSELAVPQGRRYSLVGQECPDFNLLRLDLMTDTGRTMDEIQAQVFAQEKEKHGEGREIYGLNAMRPDQLLTSPIWQI